jgi:hypothetical protein
LAYEYWIFDCCNVLRYIRKSCPASQRDGEEKWETGKREKGEKGEGSTEKKRIESFEDSLVWQKGIV